MNPDFLDLLRALHDAEARFLVVGAYAVALHAEPRATGDLDLWIDRSPDNVRRVYQALAVFGAPLAELSADDLTQPELVFQVGVAPRRIDVLTSLTALNFEEAWPHRVETTIDGLTLAVLGRDDLLKNKRALGRLQDLADVERIEQSTRA